MLILHKNNDNTNNANPEAERQGWGEAAPW